MLVLAVQSSACGRRDDAPEVRPQPSTAIEQSAAVAGSEGSEKSEGPEASAVPADVDTPAASPTESPTGTVVTPERSYVGAERCATCHPAETERWLGSDHDLAMQPATGPTVLGNFDDARFVWKGQTTSFHHRDGKYVIRTQGPDGEMADFDVAYTFGVEPLQQYLVPLPGGRLQAFGVAWDSRPATAGGQRWFHLYPDEDLKPGDALHWTGPDQSWNYMCAECHSTGVRKGFDAITGTYETTFEEVNVACESCHGPGSAHVAWAEAPRDGAAAEGVAGASAGGVDGDGLLVNLSRADAGRWVLAPGARIAHREPPLSSHVEVELCARCHARRSELTEDYVVGQPLAATHRPSLLEPGLYHPDGQILGEVYVYGSFLQSRMYAAGVTCSDCHDPHAPSIRDNPDEVCARCHLPAAYATPAHHHHETGSPGASCVACHMPSRTYMVVDPRRDHSFRVPRPDLTARIGVPNACGACHTKQPARWAAEQIATWYPNGRSGKAHYGEALWAAWNEQPDARERLLAVAGDRSQAAIVRASAVEALGDYPGPDTAHAVEQAAHDEDPLLRMAAAETVATLPPAVASSVLGPLLDDSVLTVRIAAGRAAASLAAARARSADDPAAPSPAASTPALEQWVATQQLAGDRAEAMTNLGSLYAELGAFEPAERAYRTAMKRDPTFVPAYVNLADLYRAAARDDDSEHVLLQALAIDDQAAAAHHALGLARVRQKRYEEALADLKRAVELAPDEPRYAYVYAIALHSMQRTDQAIAVLEAAEKRRPANAQLLQALATILRDQGRTQDALGYARRLVAAAPYDPSAQALVRQLEGTP